jgi:hypothetical protein
MLVAAACAAVIENCVIAAVPGVCSDGGYVESGGERAPRALTAYVGNLGHGAFDLRSVCTHWAASFSRRHRGIIQIPMAASGPVPARLILFPAAGVELRQFAEWAALRRHVERVERGPRFVVASFASRMSSRELHEFLQSPQVGYAEPDCDGPDFATSSLEPVLDSTANDCWRRPPRLAFPSDPCIDDLWGHSRIGWDSTIAARSVPRLVAILDSGIDASHEDLSLNVVRVLNLDQGRSEGGRLNARCAISGRCYPHGTEMAGTIGGRMDNGIGIAGVAPNSDLLPIVISRPEHGKLARLSTIAHAIDIAAARGAHVINISARWPVDSRAVGSAISAAAGGSAAGQRLVVTGYATSLDNDETVREYFPSQYRCLPGLLAAVPGDMGGDDLFNPTTPPNATDGRIRAPGVDIVVTTTENSERGYALSEAAGASSAAAYVSGAVALVWGSPPLNTCDAQQIKRLLFCRSKSSTSSRYPWINVDFLGELGRIGAGADCRAAMEALGCN